MRKQMATKTKAIKEVRDYINQIQTTIYVGHQVNAEPFKNALHDILNIVERLEKEMQPKRKPRPSL